MQLHFLLPLIPLSPYKGVSYHNINLGGQLVETMVNGEGTLSGKITYRYKYFHADPFKKYRAFSIYKKVPEISVEISIG